MGIQISQCCSSKKSIVNEETLQRKTKNQMPLISAKKQQKENSVRSNQSSGKMASNTLINEAQHDQARSVQDKNAIFTEDILSRRIFLADLKQSDQQKQQEKITQSIKINEELQKSLSDVDEQKEQIDDFNRALIVPEDQNEQIKQNSQEMQQYPLKKVIDLDKVHIKSNCYRDNFEKVQIPLLDMIISGEKDLKEFDEEDSNSDSAEEENKRDSIKKGVKSLQALQNYERGDGSQDGQDGQDDDEEEEEEEENSDDESYDLFDSGGVLERIMRENRHKKNGLGIDSHSGQTYVLKQYSPEDVQELIFDYDLAQRIKQIQMQNNCFCMIHAIRKQSDEGLLIVQNHEKGGSLSLFLDTAFNEKEAKIWMIKILQALQILHESHLEHGNLKPNNILLGQGQLKLTDINMFKNKKHLHNLYSAPELLQRDQLTEKSDIWSACLIFIEMRTGVMPYLEKDPDMTVEKLKEKIERMELRLPFDIETQEFIRMMNNIDPNKRKTAKELLNSRYLRCENHNFDKQYLNQLQKKQTLRKLNNTKNFDQSMMMMSKPLLSEQQTFMYNSQIKPGGIQKGTTINIDKLNDKGTKQYGITSVLTVVNIKERDLQQQESYMPISVANLMTTQLTNNGMVSQQISNKDNKDDSSGPISQNLKQEIQYRKSADYNKQVSNNVQQQQQKQMQQENISKVLKQWITVKTTLEQQQEQDEKQKQFQMQQEKLINQIKQRENEEDDDEEGEDEEDDEAEDKNGDTQNNGQVNDLDHKLQSKKSEIRNNQKKQTNKINLQNNLIKENEARMKQLEIEQKLLDILNQNLGGEGNSFVSDTSQDLKNSFIDGGKVKYKSSFQDLSLVQSGKVPSSQMRFATKLLEKAQNPQKKEGDIISDTKQMQSIQIISPKDEEVNANNAGKSAADQMIEEMNRILNEGVTVFSQESLDDLKRQISTQNFVGLRRLLTISSQQKTSNSLKTLKTLGNSNAKQGKCKTENSPMRDEEQKQSSRLQVDDQGYYFIEDYIQKTKNIKKDEKAEKINTSKDIKNTSVNNFTQNDETKQDDKKQEEDNQDPEYQKQLLQQEIEQKLLDILNQNGDCEEGSFLQASYEIIKTDDKNNQEENKIPSINQNILTQKQDAYQKQQSTNSLRIIKMKSNMNSNTKTPEQIADEMNRILNEGISAFSLESYEEIKRQISTQNFNTLKRTLSNNKQLRTLNSIKTQKTLQNSSIINKSLNSNNLGQNKIKIDLNSQE
ncbi:Serine/Threonine kinase domain protein (macronuclear) [Tetrahymena thermophila SB210]|uniref:non-specific serine/threonine protein kinase n=1 Tax=Tetrahymena thermophila (strain SB210) TaxID=312017 RepID=Q23Q04_TETTS|nr:Serine/Threonine kinase domain protein [Tetrahymena thermophila SB210]EAR98531.2 Serine/Threonine kinase domain protein [Tetrahymena thermophila SB210]|eukprot:XP_001018776.2 Serine/Threonine kinase domain protein [Tetrahymena thermophila SB210]